MKSYKFSPWSPATVCYLIVWYESVYIHVVDTCTDKTKESILEKASFFIENPGTQIIRISQYLTSSLPSHTWTSTVTIGYLLFICENGLVGTELWFFQ